MKIAIRVVQIYQIIMKYQKDGNKNINNIIIQRKCLVFVYDKVRLLKLRKIA